MGIGRPSEYTDEIAQELCSRMIEGRSVRSICDDEDMPGRRTVLDWLKRYPDFVRMYNIALEMRADTQLEEILDIADDARNDWMALNDPENPGYKQNGEAVNRSRLRVDTRKWGMARMRPMKYGDKLELAGDKERPLQMIHRIELVDLK